MSLFKKLLFTSLLLSSAVAAASCGSGGSNPFGSGGGGTGGADGPGGPGPSTGATPTSTASSGAGGSVSTGCMTAADCNDGFSCTIDVCTDGLCSHSAGPNAGTTACPAGSFCEVHTGCVPGAVCATTDQCVQKLGDDVCKTHIVCDAATSICTYQILDKDSDGHPPVVCKGDDCDDSDATKFPGNIEVCNSKDDDCDGTIDVGATCPGSGVCTNGTCSCAPENMCGEVCADKTSDPNNCGMCGNKCPSTATCVGSQCKCAGNATACDGQCVDTTTDSNHCGNCTTPCAPGSTCQGGVCKCPGGLKLCNNACVDTSTDTANCGTCNNVCSVCQAGNCITCATTDLFISQDLSGSMADVFDTSPSRLQAVQGALGTFLMDPLSSGMGVGIGYFPIVKPMATCVVDADCGLAGVCFSGICLAGSAGGDSCIAMDYAMPIVPIALLPGNASALTTSINAKMPEGSTPQAPALQGALTYAKAWAIAHSTHRVAVVLITDGLPNECTPNQDVPTDTAKVAAVYASGSPAVKTFVVGIGPGATQAQWDQIAASGGTGTARVALTTASLGTALSGVRTAFKTCP